MSPLNPGEGPRPHPAAPSLRAWGFLSLPSSASREGLSHLASSHGDCDYVATIPVRFSRDSSPSSLSLSPPLFLSLQLSVCLCLSLCMSLSLSHCLNLSLSLCLSICVFLCFSISVSLCFTVSVSLSLSVQCMCVCSVCVCLPVTLSLRPAICLSDSLHRRSSLPSLAAAEGITYRRSPPHCRPGHPSQQW